MVKYIISNEILFSNKGSYRDKINAISSKLNSFGGTYVFFDKDEFYFGGLSLSCINYDVASFRDYSTDYTYNFSLNSFSDSFLFDLLICFLNECKEQLTENSFNKIVKYLEEKFA